MVLSIVSFDSADVAGAVWPLNEEPANLGGRIGSWLVYTGYLYLGVGTYLAVGLLGIYGALVFFRRKAADWPLRAIGGVALVLAFASLFGGSFGDSSVMPTRGGIIGGTVFALLESNFGMTGAYLILGFIALLSFLLATDILFYPIIRDLLNPLGEDTSISGPLDMDIPDPLGDEETDSKRSWLAKFKSRRSEEADDDTIEFTPDMAVIPDDAEATEPANRRPAVRATKPKKKTASPVSVMDIEGVSAEEFKASMKNFTAPATSLLQVVKNQDNPRIRDSIERNAEIIRSVYRHFKMDVKVVGYTRGPTVTTFDLEIPPDLLVQKLSRAQANLELNLRVQGVRITTGNGKGTVGVEVPNAKRDTVGFRELIECKEFEDAKKSMELPIAFGKDAQGNVVIRDLASTPHLLIGGATGQGKSVLENVVLASMLMSRSPEDLRLVMVDPKMVEFAPYAHIPHLLSPVIIESRKAVGAFEWLVEEMDNRYLLLKNTGVRKITEYNELSKKERLERATARGMDEADVPEHMPYVVAIVDEFADLMQVAADTKVDALICRIAQKARAAGIHLILVTQSPRKDVVTGIIKANIPARVSLRVNTGTDSRVVLDQTGAETLLGKGDLLMMMPGEASARRVQSAFVSDDDLNNLLNHLRGQARPHYVVDPNKLSSGGGDGGSAGGVSDLDGLFENAVDEILASGRGSAVFLRTSLSVGHTRATRLVIQMEQAGILGPSRGSKEREILITFEEWEERKASGDLLGTGGA